MSYYTNSIVTHELQANTNSTNFRTEFRLDANKLYMSNMRLLNIGWVQNVAGIPAVNRLVGTYGIIKNLSLFDDNELIDGLDNFNLWAAFLCYNKKNDDNRSTNYFLKKNNMAKVSVGLKSNGAIITKVLDDNLCNNTVGVGAWLDLSAYLDFLKKSSFVSTHYFKRLRIVIEYETDVGNLTPNSLTTTVSSLEPLLVVDEMVDDDIIMSVMKNMNDVQYQPIETSRVIMPVHANLPTSAQDEGQVQDVAFTIQGFNNKSINRFTVMPVGTQVVSTLYGKLMAQGMNLNNFNITTSQGDLFSGRGITLDNQRRKMLTDLWGDCTDQVGAQWVNTATSAITDAAQSLGFLEPISVKLEQEMVRNFQMLIGRKSVWDTVLGTGNQANSRYNQELHLHCFAEVVRQVVYNPKDMSYLITYV